MNESELIKRLDSLPEIDKHKFVLDTLGSNPTYLRFKNRLAGIHISNEEFQKARDIIETELEKEYSLMFQIKLVELELKMNDIKVAKINANHILKLNPNQAYGHILLGRIETKEGNKEGAIKSYKQAITLNNKSVGAVANLFDIYLIDLNFVAAENILKKAIQHKPDEFHYSLRQGKLLQAQGHFEKAISQYESAKSCAINLTQAANAVLTMSIARAGKDSDKKIIADLELYVQEYPDHHGLKYRLIHSYLNSSEYDKALVLIDTILSIKPENLRALSSKATIYNRQGLNEKAESICDRILVKDPNQINALLLKANLLKANEQNQDAYLLYQKAISAHPCNLWPYHALAQLIFQEGDIKGAFQILDQGLKNIPNSKYLIIKKVQISLNCGKYEDALNILNKQIGKEQFSPQSHYLKAQIFQRQGKFLKAKTVIKRIKSECAGDSKWENLADQFLANTAFLEYDYKTAESILKILVDRVDNAHLMRSRLSLLYLLKGDVNKAVHQLEIATQEIEDNKLTGKVLIPLIGHTAKVINELTTDPRLKIKALASFKLNKQERLHYLAKQSQENPDYFGFALYLSNELRKEGLFNRISTSLAEVKSPVRIPKTIIQYWDTPDIPNSVISVMNSWKNLNPGYAHQIFSRNTAYRFIKYKIGFRASQAFLNCDHPAMQADFFRLAYLSKFGGFYADADDKCIRPMSELAESGAELILKLGDFGCISNNFLACIPKNKIISNAFQKGTENMLSYFNEGPWFRLGPGHLTKCVTNYLADFIGEENFSYWPRIKVIDQIETRKFLSQHLSLPYKSSDKSWYTAEYKRQITKRKVN